MLRRWWREWGFTSTLVVLGMLVVMWFLPLVFDDTPSPLLARLRAWLEW
jgi:hypothetical protein